MIKNHILNIEKQSEALKTRIRNDCLRYDELFKVGTEIEACLLDDKGVPVNASPLIKELSETPFIKQTGCKMDCEYGSCQFEFKTPPISFKNLFKLNQIYEEFIIENLDRVLTKVYKERNVIPVFLGANPSPKILNDENITKNVSRYKKLFQWQKKLPKIQLEGQIFDPAHIAASIQGFHFHLQARNPNHVAMMFNHILNIIPTSIVLGANSKLFAGNLFSIHEPRIYLYDQSEQPNSGFPTIDKYLNTLEEYVDYVRSKKPVHARKYFELEKERHDDVRIRLNTRYYRVETRILSVQPTPKSLISMIEFFIGYIHYIINEQAFGKIQLKDIEKIKKERYSSIHNGFNTIPNSKLINKIKVQLNYAKKGLLDLKTKPNYLDILFNRLENRTSPGQYVANLWNKTYNGSFEQSLSEVLQHMWQKTKENDHTI